MRSSDAVSRWRYCNNLLYSATLLRISIWNCHKSQLVCYETDYTSSLAYYVKIGPDPTRPDSTHGLTHLRDGWRACVRQWCWQVVHNNDVNSASYDQWVHVAAAAAAAGDGGALDRLRRRCMRYLSALYGIRTDDLRVHFNINAVMCWRPNMFASWIRIIMPRP